MFIGYNTSFFWGVVEDRNDPLEIGRVRVRIFGIHSDLKVTSETHGSPTDELLWCHVMQPINSASISGVGTSPTGIVHGSHVMGIFRDDYMQDGIVVGTIGGIPQTPPNKSKGFNDPDGVYPKYVNEPDTNRLARGVVDGTIVPIKKDNLDKMKLSSSGRDIIEPVTPYDAKYPYNQVRETESGHIIELDDTPDKERIQLYHRSGTFVEVHPDGTTVVKVKGQKYEVVHENSNVHVKGAKSVHVEGSMNIYVVGDTNLNVDGNVNATIQGDATATIQGDTRATTKGDTFVTSENISIDANKQILMNAESVIINGSKLFRAYGGDLSELSGGTTKVG